MGIRDRGSVAISTARREMENAETEAVAGGFLPHVPEGPLIEIVSRLSIKYVLRSTCSFKEWHDAIINFPDGRKILPQPLQGFFYIGCDCTRNGGDGGEDGDGIGSGTDEGEDSSGNSDGNDGDGSGDSEC